MSEETQPTSDAAELPDPTTTTAVTVATPEEQARQFMASAERPTYLPWGLRMAASWSACFIIIVIAAFLIARGLTPIRAVVVIPLMVAVLLAAMLKPVQRFLARKLPNFLASLLTVIGFLAVIVGALTLVGSQVADQAGALSDTASAGYQQLLAWLRSGPFGLDATRVAELLDQGISQLVSTLRANTGSIINSATSVAQVASSLLVGFVLSLFLLIFLLADGDRIASWLVNLFPAIVRKRVRGAGALAWTTLGSYVRVQIAVAAIDAIGIALGALILGANLWLPIGVLVFLGSFIPIVGALVTGVVAVLVVLFMLGVVKALIMLAIVLAVQQIESHVLQPLLMGRAVSLHPVAVVLVVAAGSTLLGIFGAVIAVPIAAIINNVAHYLSDRGMEEEDDPLTFMRRLQGLDMGAGWRKIVDDLRGRRPVNVDDAAEGEDPAPVG